VSRRFARNRGAPAAAQAKVIQNAQDHIEGTGSFQAIPPIGGARRNLLSSFAKVPATTLEARELSKSFSGPPLFSRLSFSAGAGLTAISGRNGSGKTTLLKILALLIRPGSGSVRVLDGPRELAGEERRRAIGWAGLDLAFYEDFSARENLAFFRRAAGLPARPADIGRRLARVGLQAVANRRVGAFSTGMKQRLRLAFALLLDPAVLLLDEPAAGLDEEGRGIVAGVVEEQRLVGPVLLASNDPRDFVAPERLIELSP
jgi:ABC-type multidrug transport system ATPase subunit